MSDRVSPSGPQNDDERHDSFTDLVNVIDRLRASLRRMFLSGADEDYAKPTDVEDEPPRRD